MNIQGAIGRPERLNAYPTQLAKGSLLNVNKKCSRSFKARIQNQVHTFIFRNTGTVGKKFAYFLKS